MPTVTSDDSREQEQPISVLIADDHARTRAWVRTALERSGRFRVCAEAPDADSAVASAEREQPDVCLLDINMPGNGINATARITTARPETAVVMLTVSRQDEDLFDALCAGASGYLLKGIDEEGIGDALHRVLDGEATLPGSLVARLVEEFRNREYRRVALPDVPLARLTGTEWEVLELMREGWTTAEIAERRFVSQTTVRSHVSAILRKLGVPDRRSAIEMLGPRHSQTARATSRGLGGDAPPSIVS